MKLSLDSAFTVSTVASAVQRLDKLQAKLDEACSAKLATDEAKAKHWQAIGAAISLAQLVRDDLRKIAKIAMDADEDLDAMREYYEEKRQ